MAICPKCGTQVEDGARFCPECGGAIPVEPPVVPVQPTAEAVPEQPAVPIAQPPVIEQPPVYQQYPPQYQPAQYQPPYPSVQNQTYQQNQYQQQSQYQQSQQPSWGAPPPPSGPSVRGVYDRAFDILAKKPIRLWGLSLMFSLLTVLASLFGALPIISLPIIFVLEVGMISIYLDGIRGKEVNSDQLFSGFKSFFRFAGGMGWMYLWILIWGLIPIAGIVMAVIKAYSYRFTPYILLNDPEVSATEALRRSMEMTEGFKGRMFGADIIVIVCVWVVTAVFSLLGTIAFIGIVFRILLVVFTLLAAAFVPLLMGLVGAAFYDEIESEAK